MLYKFIGMLKVPGKKTEAMRQAPASVKGHILCTVHLSSGRAELQLSGTVRSQRGTITRPGSLHVVVNVAACCKCVSLLSQTLHMSQNIASVSKCFSVKLCFCICLLPQFHSGRHISDNFEGLCQIFYPSVQHDAQNWLQRHE